METSKYNNLFFIQSKFSPSSEKQWISDKNSRTSWQKHASHEYRRRLRLSKDKGSRSGRTVIWPSPRHPRGKESTEDDLSVSKNTPSLFANAAGIGSWDPFGSAIPSDIPQYTREMLFHAISQQRQVFASTKTNSETNEISRSVLSYSMSSMATFYTIIFAAATHWSYAHTGSEASEQNRSLRLAYKGLALEELRKEIADLKTFAPEQLLMTIVTLAAHGTGEKLTPPSIEERKLASPSCKAQDFDYYSAMSWETAHVEAVQQLIEARGGLATIRTPGLANSIALADIFLATMHLWRPFFELVMSTEMVMSMWPKLANDNPLLDFLTTGFGITPELVVSRSLLKVIGIFRQLILGFNMHLNEKAPAPTLVNVVSARNAMQHDLMSIEAKLSPDNPMYKQTSELEVGKSVHRENTNIIHQILHDLILYAIMGLSLLTLFPLPRRSGTHSRVSRHLKRIVQQSEALNISDFYFGLRCLVAF